MNIALLTDFGTKDYFVAAMKGVILSINIDAKIVDISHEIPTQDIYSASFNLMACYKNFPHQTIFVTVVDPGVGSSRRAILLETNDYFFIAPDNALLSFIFQNEKNFKVYELTNQDYFCEKISSTFHGRDIFSPVAAHISNGVNPKEFGDEIFDYKKLNLSHPTKKEADVIEAEIIYIDHFGNLILNIQRKDLPKDFLINICGQNITELREYFSESTETDISNNDLKLFGYVGSLGFLEIAVFEDSAANILNVKIGDKANIKG